MVIADYLKRDYDKVYLARTVMHDGGTDIQSISFYLMCNYEIIDIEETIDKDIDGKNVALIIIPEDDIEIRGLEEKELNTKYAKLYTNEGGYENFEIKLNK